MKSFSRRKRVSRGQMAILVCLILGSVFMLLPFVWMVSTSFKFPQEVISFPPTLIPKVATLSNYKNVISRVPLARMFRNSVFLSTSITLIQLFTSCLAGYVFGKFEFRGKEAIFIMILSSMMIPFQVVMIPTYLLMVAFKWVDSYKAIIIPGLFTSFGIFLMRQYMYNIPNDLIDAAKIDGCSDWGTFYRVVVPLSKPALAALGIFTFLGNWDAFLWPLIVINKESLFTLPLGIAMLSNQWWTEYGMVMAGSTIAVIPVLLVFLLLQQRFIEGITLTGLKS